MTLDEAEHALLSDEGEIRPIIEWLGTTGDPALLLHLLRDEQTRLLVLYIYSELPGERIPSSVFEAVEDLLPTLAEGSREQACGQEILAERDPDDPKCTGELSSQVRV